MKNKYDVCVISFSDIRFDGRTKNLIDCLAKNGKKAILFSTQATGETKPRHLAQATPVAVVGHVVKVNPFLSANMKRELQGKGEPTFDNIIVEVPHNRRVFIKLLTFFSSIKNYLAELDCDMLWIADFYSLPAVKYMKNKEMRICYDSREIYTKLAALHSSPIKQSVVSYLERRYIKSVHTVATSGKRDSAYIKNLYKLNIPIYELYNYPKSKEHIKSNIIREKLHIPAQTKILLYQGVLLEGRGIVPVINALRELCNAKRESYAFVVLGEGKYKNYLLNYAHELNVEQNVYFVGNINYEDLHTWTCAADIGFCNIEPITYSYQLALPNKLFEYMLAELPVIATDLPALREILEKTRCGKIISQQNTVSEIISAIEHINNEITEIKDNIRKMKFNYVYETQNDLIMHIVEN